MSTVQLFGGLRPFAPGARLELELAGLMSVTEIKAEIARRLAASDSGGSGEAGRWVKISALAFEDRILVDGERVELKPGARLALLPPVNGG
jgi:molybdopterin converting factor small subunit